MSAPELQHASMGPRRWIAKSSSKERNSDGVLPHVVRQHPMPAMDDVFNAGLDALNALYLVPGGRYLFVFSFEQMILWDLGPPYSSGKEPYIISTLSVNSYGLHLVHSTPDGLGLRIFILRTTHDLDDMASFYIYEIYPESTSPQITQIACTHVPNWFFEGFYSLSYDRLIFVSGQILTVWDYKANKWARWSIEGEYSQIVITRSTVTLIRTYGVSVWKIPPLLPESSLSMSTDPSVVPPAFELNYPEDHDYPDLYQAPCDWYSGTPQPLYYDVMENPDADLRTINRFDFTINSKISGGTLYLLNTFEIPLFEDYLFSEVTRICQDKNVSIGTDRHTGFLGAHVTDMYDQQLPSFLTPLCHHPILNLDFVSFCPVAGRVVYCQNDQSSSSIIILDF